MEEWVYAMRYSYDGPEAGEGAFRLHLDPGPSPFNAVALRRGRRISVRETRYGPRKSRYDDADGGSVGIMSAVDESKRRPPPLPPFA